MCRKILETTIPMLLFFYQPVHFYGHFSKPYYVQGVEVETRMKKAAVDSRSLQTAVILGRSG